MDEETKKCIEEIVSRLDKLSKEIQELKDSPTLEYPFDDNPNPSIRFISVHHSASRADISRADVMQWHAANGWAAEHSGYHVFVRADGTVEWASMDAMLKYIVGHQNPHTLGVCLAGNFHPNHPGYTGAPTPAQLDSLKQVLFVWGKRYPLAKVVPHRFFGGTVCPGDELTEWLDENYAG